jgi:exonuclease VII small subunit
MQFVHPMIAMWVGGVAGVAVYAASQLIDIQSLHAKTLVLRTDPQVDNFDVDHELGKAFFLLQKFKKYDEAAFSEAILDADNIVFVAKMYLRGRPDDIHYEEELQLVGDMYKRCHEALVRLENAVYQFELVAHTRREAELKKYHDAMDVYRRCAKQLEDEENDVVFDGSIAAMNKTESISQRRALLTVPEPPTKVQLQTDMVDTLKIAVECRLARWLRCVSDSIRTYAVADAENEARQKARAARGAGDGKPAVEPLQEQVDGHLSGLLQDLQTDAWEQNVDM